MSSHTDLETLRKSLVGSFKKDEVLAMNNIIVQMLDLTSYESEAIAKKVGMQVHEINKKYSDTALYGDISEKGKELMKKLKQFISASEAALGKPAVAAAAPAGGSVVTTSSTVTAVSAALKSKVKAARAPLVMPQDPFRSKIVEMMISEFKKGGADATAAMSVACELEKEIERQIPFQPSNKDKYKERCRNLTTSLKINLELLHLLYNESVSYSELLSMSVAELAPGNLKKSRESKSEDDRLARDTDVNAIYKAKILVENGLKEAAPLDSDDNSDDEGFEIECGDD